MSTPRDLNESPGSSKWLTPLITISPRTHLKRFFNPSRKSPKISGKRLKILKKVSFGRGGKCHFGSGFFFCYTLWFLLFRPLSLATRASSPTLGELSETLCSVKLDIKIDSVEGSHSECVSRVDSVVAIILKSSPKVGELPVRGEGSEQRRRNSCVVWFLSYPSVSLREPAPLP